MSDRRTDACAAVLSEIPTEYLEDVAGLEVTKRLLHLAYLTGRTRNAGYPAFSEEVGQLQTEVAHRERALRHLAETLSFVRGEYTIDELIGNAMRVTAHGRPFDRSLQITTTADVAPLLKALDGLATALRDACQRTGGAK